MYGGAISKSRNGHLESILFFVRMSLVLSAISLFTFLSTDRSVFGNGFAVYYRKLQELLACP